MERGRSRFSVGERVLCFEPDQSKARVLYDAKILDIDFGKEGRESRKEVEYKIHFQGWNSAWDRWANEHFVLKSTEENKKLQRKLAKQAIKKLRKHQGRRKVHLPGVASAIRNNTSSDSGTSSDEGSTNKRSCRDGEDLPAIKRRHQRPVVSSPKQYEVSNNDAPAADLISPLGLQRKPSLFDLPVVLKKRLEEDNNMITNKHLLVELPAKLNIVQILENYTKYFALYVAKLPSSEKLMKGDSQTSDIILPEKSLNLCKEMCQDLRIIFDFVLPMVLLYDSEQAQHEVLATNTKTPNDSEKMCSGGAAMSEDSDSSLGSPNPLSTTGDDIMPTKLDMLNSTRKLVKPTKSPTNHRKSAEEQIIEETHTYLIPHQPNLDKTGLSSDSHGRRRSSRLSNHLNFSSHTGDAMASASLHSTDAGDNHYRHATNYRIAMDTEIFLRPPLNHYHGGKSSLYKNAPLSLLCKAEDRHSCASPYIHLKQMCKEAYISTAGEDIKKAVMLGETWRFTLFPANYQPPVGANIPPSLIYGIQHLLRLFVKLPYIFSTMSLPDYKLKIIHKHLRILFKFLAEYESEIFAVSAGYIAASSH